ncbi:hypothetical protein JKP88DRAFT_203412 [Tribonema minus]|uniref:Uncharacterized protein n=1 Tax=Tribonema minus TaxID=303371 RepID=A0A836C8A3_9STRA|nr:hypothetical protein JKP88DRAFT_203412 [Tribonema minus]
MGAAVPPGIPLKFGHANIDIRAGAGSARGLERNADTGAVFLLTAASRGLGLELAKQLASRTQGHVIASCRQPSKALELQALAQSHPGRMTVLELDVTDQASVDAAAAHVAALHNGRLDALFNVAGLLGDGRATPGPERSLGAIQRDWLRHSMEVNVIGPVMLAQAMAPHLRTTGQGRAKTPSVVVNFSARVGSISDNRLGGWHSYRMSKSALNQATKCMALELKRQGTWAFAYHPGTTDTDLSRPFQANVKPEKLFTPAFTVGRMLDLCDNMDQQHTGGFYDYSGTFLLW